MKDDAIVLRETEAIMRDLPHELRHDEEILDAVIGSLQQGQTALMVRQDAIEIAHMKLESKVDKGFELVASEFQKVRHEAELDRVHAQYAKEEAIKAKISADAALIKINEVATTAAVAVAKAEGARDVAKSANKYHFDPLVGAAFIAILIFVILAIFTRVEVKRDGEKDGDKRQQQTSVPAPVKQVEEPIYRCDPTDSSRKSFTNCVRK
jgi:hypothetical protein